MATTDHESRPFLSVTAPVFNEQANIEQVLLYWNEVLDAVELPSEIVLTNDGSTDNTPQILARVRDAIPRLAVVTHESNHGYGKALTDAIQHSRGQWVVTIDSDGQFDLKDCIPLLRMALSDNLDGVTGYRNKKKDTYFRVFADRALNWIVRAFFGVKFRDTNCALKVIKGDFLRQINIEARGYPAPTELCIKLTRLGAKLGEAGVSHAERAGGMSKLRPFQTSVNFLKFLTYLRFKIYLYNQKVLHNL